jgi:uncharacterized repeat protein (TIGR01451 family)
MKTLFAMLCLTFLAGNALAAGDGAVTSFTADKSVVTSGEEVTFTIKVKNNGPDPATDLNINLLNSYSEPMYVLSATPGAGWQCSAVFTNCWTASMANGEEDTLVMRVLAPATVRPAAFVVTAHLSLSSGGAIDNNRLELPLTLQPSSRVADLSITLSAPPNPIPQSTPLTLAYDVRNNGPQDLTDVRVSFYSPVQNPTAVFEGAGWTCTTLDPYATLCRRDSLGANANAPLSVKTTTPSTATQFETRAEVFSTQPHFEENLSNNRAWRGLSIGSASDWSRILVPLADRETPGALGSLWKTEIRGVLETTGVLPPMEPNGCGALEDPCSPPPLNRLFDAFDEQFVIDGLGPQFIFIARAQADVLRMSTRVYDASKSATTAGAFVPMPWDEDFEPESLSLVGIPAAPEFRSTLRIYDLSGVDGSEVEYMLYGDEESQPFHAGTWRLLNDDAGSFATTALLPRYPASVQVDLSALVPAKYSRVRVAMRTVTHDNANDPPMKIWGFVSITNNQTSHVTVVTP